MRNNYLKIWNLRVQKNQHIEKIMFKSSQVKVVQIKFLTVHITIKNLKIYGIYDMIFN